MKRNFELFVLSDDTIKLRNLITNKTYHFKGRGLISYIRPNSGKKNKSESPSINGKKGIKTLQKSKPKNRLI